jgi:Ca2+-binding RTX toxin-like protein
VSGALTVATVGESGNPIIDSLLWGTKWAMMNGNKAVVPVHFFTPRFATSSAYAPTVSELATGQMMADLYSQYIDLDLEFSGVSSSVLNGITLVAQRTSSTTVYGSTFPLNVAGAFSIVQVFRDNAIGKGNNIIAGGKDFVTYLHEFGHALGLAHPHDTGGATDFPSIMFDGVVSSQDIGSFALNQGVFTTMGYNDGWLTGPLGASSSADYGFQKTPMALDIMALQYLYGANLQAALGNDSYVLPGQNVAGTGYSCLWDAGGIDTIIGATDRANVIDLRSATGLVEAGGGGFLSYADGVHGGFTIAKGAIIENARGGNLSDRLTGNAANNLLEAGAGDDILIGGQGADVLVGGSGADRFVFTSLGDSGTDMLTSDLVIDFVPGVDVLDFSAIDAHNGTNPTDDFTFMGQGRFIFAGEIRYRHQVGETLIELNIDGDADAEMMVRLAGELNLWVTDFVSVGLEQPMVWDIL